MLEGRDALGAGLGLAAFALILFAAPESGTMLVLLPRFGPMLLGLPGILRAAEPFGGFAGGCGCSMT